MAKSIGKFGLLFDLLEDQNGWLEIAKKRGIKEPIIRAHKGKTLLDYEAVERADTYDRAAERLMGRLKKSKKLK